MFANKRQSVLLGLFALIFGFLNVYVYFIEKELLKNQFDILILITNVLIVASLTYILVSKLYAKRKKIADRIYQSTQNEKSISSKRYFFAVFIIQFILWLPVFLAYYPGIFSYDVGTQLPQTIGAPGPNPPGYSTYQPLAHTVYIQFFYYIIGEKIFGNSNIGIAFASVTQMIIFSLMMSFTHLYLYKVKVKKIIRYILIVVTGVSPFFSMLSISTTKDTFFTGFFAMLFVCLCCYIKKPMLYSESKLLTVIYTISIAGTMLFRNNGIYCVAAFVVVLLIKAIKKKRYRFFVYTAVGVLVGLIISGSLNLYLKAEKGSVNEMLSVPFQQIACTYIDHKDELSQEDIEQVLSILPDSDRYNPYRSDTVKISAAGSGNAKKMLQDLASIYIKLGLRYPGSYVKAFTQLNAGYFSLADTSYSEIYGKGDSSGVLLSGFHSDSLLPKKHKFVQNSYLPLLESKYEELYTDNKYLNIFGINILFSPALYFWTIVLLMVFAIISRKYKTIPLLIFLGIFILTLLAAPCVLIRYALPYIVCVPLLITCVMEKTEEKQ